MKSCIYCNAEVNTHAWGGAVCVSCGSVMVLEPPTDDQLAKYYDKFLNNYHGGGGVDGASARQLNWAKRYLEIVIKYKQIGSLIDVGPANNPFPNLALFSGLDVTVMDYKRPTSTNSRIPFIKGCLNVRLENSEADKYKDRFDIVTAWAVLEHCKNTKLAIESLVFLSKLGGHIIISTPEVGGISDKFAAGRSAWFYPPEHIFLISRKALIKLFAAQGCELVEARKFEFSSLRWILKYGIFAVECVAGVLLMLFSKQRWLRMRDRRVSKYAGVTMCVFRKVR